MAQTGQPGVCLAGPQSVRLTLKYPHKDEMGIKWLQLLWFFLQVPFTLLNDDLCSFCHRVWHAARHAARHAAEPHEANLALGLKGLAVPRLDSI